MSFVNLEDVMNSDYVLGMEEVKGTLYPIVNWSDIVERYPDKWVMYTNSTPTDDSRVFTCTLLSICDNEDRAEEKLRLMRGGYMPGSRRTIDYYGGGII